MKHASTHISHMNLVRLLETQIKREILVSLQNSWTRHASDCTQKQTLTNRGHETKSTVYNNERIKCDRFWTCRCWIVTLGNTRRSTFSCNKRGSLKENYAPAKMTIHKHWLFNKRFAANLLLLQPHDPCWWHVCLLKGFECWKRYQNFANTTKHNTSRFWTRLFYVSKTSFNCICQSKIWYQLVLKSICAVF